MNTSDSVAADWHGFTDTESGINSYHWCVGTTPAVDNRKPDKTECDILGWSNYGLHTSASLNISSHIPKGIYVLLIYICIYVLLIYICI